MAYSAYVWDTKGGVETTAIEKVSGDRTDTPLVWLDIERLGEAEAVFLRDELNLHSIVVDDAMTGSNKGARAEMFGDVLAVVVHGINYSATEVQGVSTTPLSLLISHDSLITLHRDPLLAVEATRSKVEANTASGRTDSVTLAYWILDFLVQNMAPVMETTEATLDVVEEEAIRNPGKETLENLLTIKRSSQQLQRFLRPNREVMNRLARGEFDIIGTDERHYFQDAYDRMLTIDASLVAIRERVESALAMYLSAVANKQNELTRVLSVVASVFLPLGLLAGVYGMNFEYMPELKLRYGYFVVVTIIAVAVVTIIWWLWGARLLGRGKRTLHDLRPSVIRSHRLKGATTKNEKRRTFHG